MTAVEILCSRLCQSNHPYGDGAGTKSVCKLLLPRQSTEAKKLLMQPPPNPPNINANANCISAARQLYSGLALLIISVG